MAILGSADLLLELIGEPGHETERTQLATLKHAADSMNRLIRDLLDVTRLESGPLHVERTHLNLADVIDDVVGMFEISAKARRLKFIREAPQQRPLIYGDRDRLAQALSNLVANAVKFTPDGGQVRVSVEVRSDGVYAYVRDTGPEYRPIRSRISSIGSGRRRATMRADWGWVCSSSRRASRRTMERFMSTVCSTRARPSASTSRAPTSRPCRSLTNFRR
jgi:light-regulated signal transduction histidine kinase (bacteriophytochrome)